MTSLERAVAEWTAQQWERAAVLAVERRRAGLVLTAVDLAALERAGLDL